MLNTTEPVYVRLSETTTRGLNANELVQSGINFVETLNLAVEDNLKYLRPTSNSLSILSASSDTFYSTAGTISQSLYKKEITTPIIYPQPSIEKSLVASKLSQIDKSLGDAYMEIIQIYYGTTSDPVRAAISMMRQVFDHFFEKLAPDAEVRTSKYWKPKKGPNQNLVTREERISYAVNTHINNQDTKNIMIANIKNILKTYKVLNKLHKRGSLNEPEARNALMTMMKFLENWVIATTT